MFIKNFFVYYQLVSYLAVATLPPRCNHQFEARTYKKLKEILERCLEDPQNCFFRWRSNENKSKI